MTKHSCSRTNLRCAHARASRRTSRCPAGTLQQLRLALFTVIMCATLPASITHAQHDDEAHGLYTAGAAAFEAGRFDEALQYFERAYELSERPQLLYNIGQAADRGRHDETALQAFRRYLELTPDATHREEIEGRIRVLERTAAAREPVSTMPASVPEEAIVTTSSEPDDRPRSASPDVAAIVLTSAGAAAVLGGAIMLGVGVPDLQPPREGLLFGAEEARIQNGRAVSGVGGALLGIGAIIVIVGAVMLAQPAARDSRSALRLTASGLSLAF